MNDFPFVDVAERRLLQGPYRRYLGRYLAMNELWGIIYVFFFYINWTSLSIVSEKGESFVIFYCGKDRRILFF